MATKTKTAKKAAPTKTARKVTPGARENTQPVTQTREVSDKEVDKSIAASRQNMNVESSKNAKNANVVNSAGLEPSTNETNSEEKTVDQGDPVQNTIREAERQRLEGKV